MTSSATIGLMLGSLRQHGNNAGVASWVSTLAQRVLSTHSTGPHYAIQQIFPFAATTADPSQPLYLGPVMDPHMAATVTTAADYQSPVTQRWSATVRSCVAFVVVSPQSAHIHPHLTLTLTVHVPHPLLTPHPPSRPIHRCPTGTTGACRAS